MGVSLLNKARAKASRPSYRRGGLVLGQVDWTEFSPESVDLVGLRALLADPVVLIEVETGEGDWARLSAELRAQTLEALPLPAKIDPVTGALSVHPDQRRVKEAALAIGHAGVFLGEPEGGAGVTEFGVLQAEIDDLTSRLAVSVQQFAEAGIMIEALVRENAELKAKAAPKPKPKPKPAAKAPKAATPPASPAPAEEPAAPAAEAAPSETAPET